MFIKVYSALREGASTRHSKPHCQAVCATRASAVKFSKPPERKAFAKEEERRVASAEKGEEGPTPIRGGRSTTNGKGGNGARKIHLGAEGATVTRTTPTRVGGNGARANGGGNGRARTPSGNGSNGAGVVRPRRGWRETIEPGLYRAHRVGCRATFTRQPGTRCDCPFQAHLPTGIPGRTYPQNLEATTLRDAREEKARKQRAARIINGTGRDGAAARATLSEYFWNVFLEKHQLRPATYRNYARIFKTYLEPVVGKLRLGAINEEHIAELIRHLDLCARRRREITGKRNADWITQQLIPLQSALSAAVRWRRIPTNPLRSPTLPDCAPKRPGEIDPREDPKAILSKDQLEALYEAAVEATGRRNIGARDLSLFKTTYAFALRNSEARGIRWTDIDWDERHLNLERQIDAVTGKEAQTKGKRARRPPGGEDVFSCLEEWQYKSVIKGGADPRGYVWQGEDRRRPMPISLPNRRIRTAQRRAGLLDKDGKPLIVFHGLRHTRASHLLLDGVPMLEVSRFLGHASQLITANAYSHLVPEEEFAAIKKLFVEA
jgi:integrase